MSGATLWDRGDPELLRVPPWSLIAFWSRGGVRDTDGGVPLVSTYHDGDAVLLQGGLVVGHFAHSHNRGGTVLLQILGRKGDEGS